MIDARCLNKQRNFVLGVSERDCICPENTNDEAHLLSDVGQRQKLLLLGFCQLIVQSLRDVVLGVAIVTNERFLRMDQLASVDGGCCNGAKSFA